MTTTESPRPSFWRRALAFAREIWGVLRRPSSVFSLGSSQRDVRRHVVTGAVTCDVTCDRCDPSAVTLYHESEKKRLNDFLAEQTAANEANKRRAREHADNAVAMADFAIKTLQDHVANQIAAMEAAAKAEADAHA